ncbi:MAG: class I SAM-dependent methyltransferase [Cyanobacteria bacterium P01_H01_bin.15]
MNDRYDLYNNWAWLYNQTMGPDYSQPQLDLLERVLLPTLPPGGHILDLCCGTGQLIAPLVASGYRVTGLDGSEDMLHFAQQNAPQAEFLLEDARTFDRPNTFDGAFSTSASLNHLMGLDALTQVFERVFASLRSGSKFIFDLNHPAQLTRWWRGQPTEGEITPDYGWIITPFYDSPTATGAFEVTIFQGADAKPRLLSRLFSPLRAVLYRLLSRPRFIGLRLKLLQNIAFFEPHWQRRQLKYPIKGHAIVAVQSALLQTGFQDIAIETIDGHTPVDDKHSAHFICTKP